MYYTSPMQKQIIAVASLVVLIILGVYVSSLVTDKPDYVVDQYGSTQNENASTTETILKDDNTKMSQATIETNKGTIVIEFYKDDAPKTVENFITLAKKGYYDGVIFHRVIEGFMIQGGDPTGTGMGGPGYKFEDELNGSTDSAKAGYIRGTVAMANAGPNTNGSQFFIMHKDVPLPYSYTIFGRVISGMEVVDAIATTQTNADDRPIEEVKMKKVTIQD